MCSHCWRNCFIFLPLQECLIKVKHSQNSKVVLIKKNSNVVFIDDSCEDDDGGEYIVVVLILWFFSLFYVTYLKSIDNIYLYLFCSLVFVLYLYLHFFLYWKQKIKLNVDLRFNIRSSCMISFLTMMRCFWKWWSWSDCFEMWFESVGECIGMEVRKNQFD